MTKAERMDDLQNRFYLALSERGFTEKGSESYNTLSKTASLILKEYRNTGRHKRIRYGFRLYNGKYHIIALNGNEPF